MSSNPEQSRGKGAENNKAWVQERFNHAAYKRGVGWSAGVYYFDVVDGWKLLELGFEPQVWDDARPAPTATVGEETD